MRGVGEIELFAPREGPFMRFPMDLELLHNPATGAEYIPSLYGGWVQGDPTEAQYPPDAPRHRVAVIDSGVLTAHSWIAKFLEPGGCMDFTGEGGEDRNGHGTVTALMALARWPEPISIVSCKVVSAGHRSGDCLIQALEWVAHSETDSVILSAGVFRKKWGRPTDCDGTCPVCRAAINVLGKGISITAAGGNTLGQLACPATLAKRGHEGIVGIGPLDADGRGITYIAGALIPYESHGSIISVSRPPSPELARAYELSSTNPEAAIAQFRLVAAGSDRDEAAFATNHLAQLYERLGRPGDAIACYQNAVVLNHSSVSPIAGIRLGNLLKSTGQDEAAIRCYREVIESGDRVHSTMAAFNLGNLFFGTGDLKQARASFQKAVELGDPEWSVKALKNLGIAQWQDGRIDEARDSFLRVIGGMPTPERGSAALNLGMMENECGNLEAAEQAFSSALALGDSRVRPLAAINLGDVFVRLSATDRAKEAYKLAVDEGTPDTAQAAQEALREL
jgi:tetratricopeptide (TPR) repeat protein